MIKLSREKVYLSKLGKEVFLNPISIADDEWISEQWDAQTLEKAFTSVDVSVIFSIFWRILDDDAKRLVAKVRLTQWEGTQESELVVSDPVEKLKHVISGAKEIVEIMKGIIETRKKSNPEVAETQKKSLKEEHHSQTQSSLISSPQSTEQISKPSESSHDASSMI
jgi:hypothetical protein